MISMDIQIIQVFYLLIRFGIVPNQTMHEFNCNGTETTIDDCKTEKQECGEREGAGIVCISEVKGMIIIKDKNTFDILF